MESMSNVPSYVSRDVPVYGGFKVEVCSIKFMAEVSIENLIVTDSQSDENFQLAQLLEHFRLNLKITGPGQVVVTVTPFR